MTDPVPLRERVRDRQTGRDQEVLAREADFASAAILRQGAKVVVLREMLTGRVRVHLASDLAAHFVPVDPSEPVSRSKLHVVPKEDDRG